MRLPQRIGCYQVTAKIGEGGMGEVYRARDTKLDRDVALKVLPEAFTSDPDRLARFEREAKVLASLNHPNIGHIYGLEESRGTKALVLELIEGPTLADRIAQGPIPVDEALPIAKQIAEALEAAHEAGVIHRDLKPANIKVREDGTVKVLDFGLAKAVDVTATGDPDQSPTLTAAATQMGVILGTAAYMSPEQARGKPVDKRADIWAFGCVLFEMLAGRPVFAGESLSDTIAHVLDREPEWDVLPSGTPVGIQKLLRRGLAKDRKQRLPDIGVARLDIDDAMYTAAETLEGLVAASPPTAWRRARPWVAGLVTGAVLATVVPWRIHEAPVESSLRKFALPLAVAPTYDDFMAVSPDGLKVAYTQDQRLWIHDLSRLDPIEIVDSDGAFRPFWSPDNNFVAYSDGQSLRKVSVQGGRSEILSAQRGYSFSGGTWTDDGTIIFAQNGIGISAVSSQGGEPRLVFALDTARRLYTAPHYLPDGHSLLLAINGFDGHNEIVVQSGDTRTSVVSSEVRIEGVTYSPTGHVLYQLGWPESEGIWAVPFSLSSLTSVGDPFLVVENGMWPSMSRDGTLVYGVYQGAQQLVWVDRLGDIAGTIGQPQGRIFGPTVSRDGTQVVAQGFHQGSVDIWSHDVARGTTARLTLDGSGLASERVCQGSDLSPFQRPK